MKTINGYLEMDGSIFKINSLDDVKMFMERAGCQSFSLRMADFEKLCSQKFDSYQEFELAHYSIDGRFLLSLPFHATEQYTIRPNTMVVCNGAFSAKANNTKRLKRLFMPDSVIAIGSQSFCGETLLEQIVFSSNLQYIGAGAFQDCSSIINLSLPSSLSYIDSSAFVRCTALRNIEIPEGVEYIGGHAFANCLSLETISFPTTLSHIGDCGLFDGCNNLKEIFIPFHSTEHFKKLFPFHIPLLVEKQL